MHKNQVGTIDLLSFGTTRNDGDYTEPLEGALEGTSISHSSMRLTFNNRDLFLKYIAGNPNIPYDEDLQDPLTGERLYSVYFSFWPESSIIGLSTANSKLFNYEHDCDISALGTPMTFSSRFSKYLRPQTETVSILNLIFGNLFSYEITPSDISILHLSRLANSLKSCLAEYEPEDKDSDEYQAWQQESQMVIDKVLQTAKDYCLACTTWSDDRIREQNASKQYRSPDLAELRLKTQQAENLMLQLRTRLRLEIKAIMFRNENVSYSTLMDALNQFMTFGNPELDTITLPLVHRSGTPGCYGLELEPLLDYIKKIADNPSLYTYNVLGSMRGGNCATVMREGLKLSVKDSPNRQLRHAFDLPWYELLLPTSPAMIMHLGSEALKIKELISTTCIKTQICQQIPESTQDKLPCLKISLTEQPEILRFTAVHVTENNEKICEFTNKLSRGCS